MFRRAQQYPNKLNKTLYNVYEAKRLAEAVGSVGRSTHLEVLRYDGENPDVPSAMLDELSKLYVSEYGPRRVPANLKLEGELFGKEADEGKGEG